MRHLKNDSALLILLTCIWCILNGKLNLFHVLFGLFISVLTLILVKLLQPYQNKTYTYTISIYRMCKFIFVVIVDIYISAYKTIQHLIRNEVNPQFVVTSTKLKRPWLQALIGNAITLTPGTVTIQLNDGNYTVLWLYPSTIRQKEIKRLLINNFEHALSKED